MQGDSRVAIDDYCGCCGREARVNSFWCDQCYYHISQKPGLRLWERTYFAQHGRDCPLKMKEVIDDICD